MNLIGRQIRDRRASFRRLQHQTKTALSHIYAEAQNVLCDDPPWSANASLSERRRIHDRRLSIRRVYCPAEAAKLPITAAKMTLADLAPDSAKTSAVSAMISAVPEGIFEGVNAENVGAELRLKLDFDKDNVAVLDTGGYIVMTNVAWQQFSLAYSSHTGQTTLQSEVGTNYLDRAWRCVNTQVGSDQAAQGIRDVLSGILEGFSLRYRCHTSVEQLWFTMTVTPLQWQGRRGALVKHANTTPRHHLSHRYQPPIAASCVLS